MGRLIDVDKLLDRISLNYNNHQNITAGAMKDMINTTPTAYDVEEVVAELEELRKVKVDMISGYCQSTISKAIDIVRKGG